MSDILHASTRNSTLEVTLHRPQSRNALSRALLGELTDVLHRAADDPGVRCILITGAPPAFCAGLDLREVAATSADQAEHDASALLTLFELIDGLTKPVIAAVNGPAVAGGAGLISVCDIVLCAKSAVIGYPEIKRGLVAAIVMTYLRRLVGERRAKYLLLTGENLDATRSVEFGLATEAVADDRLMTRAREVADQLAGFPQEAVANTKALWAKIRALGHAEAVAEARALNASMRLTAESRSGVAAFLKQ
ncbi:MAG: enoyl-CoA hydratase/isomerase family protein [Phycisphaerales bacterium]|nr:enoyl-CoA hydratase/isomerase family protein [Phycisphaerales bacterium]